MNCLRLRLVMVRGGQCKVFFNPTSLETTFQVSSMHKEVFLAFAACLGVYEHSYSLKHLILSAGASARGKSFILQLLHRSLIPGSVERVSYETKRANNTETYMNDTVLTYDEVSADLFKPGVGGPELKERLSTGRSSSRVTFVTKKSCKVLRGSLEVPIVGLGGCATRSVGRVGDERILQEPIAVSPPLGATTRCRPAASHLSRRKVSSHSNSSLLGLAPPRP